MAAAPVNPVNPRRRGVSLGSPRVGTIHVQAPTSRTPALQAFLVEFSQQPAAPQNRPVVCFQGSRGGLDGRVDGVCGTGDYPLPDLPREASRSRSAPEKSVQFGPDGATPPRKKRQLPEGPQ